MKRMTLWQRLNTGLAVMTLLLLVGVGLALWVAETRANIVHRTDQLSMVKDRVDRDLVILTESLEHGDNDSDRRRRRDAESDLKRNLEYIQSAFKEFSNLSRTAASLRDFALITLTAFENRITEISASDPPNAATYYNSNFPAIARQRDLLFRDFGIQVDDVKTSEEKRARSLEVFGMVGIGVILLASVLIGRLQSSALTQPLSRVTATLERMRQGDFTQRLNADGSDEFGILGKGLNDLADNLSSLVGQVQQSGNQVSSTATEIASTALHQQSTAREIAATTAEIGVTSKQISATSRDLVNTMNEVTRVAEDTARLASSGQAAITRMESTMRQIMDASASITARLAILSEKTANINTVVTTITKVADQTNLLSLNAAIEAEKAGEYGLGFAVVAMEIRRLADQTAVATFDIEKMVKEMQSAVAAGVTGMDRFSEEVRSGVSEIRNVSTQLAQIINQVQTLTPRFHAVNEGMHAQAAGAQQISETLAQLSEAAHQTAESLRQSNQAIEQLNGAAHGLQASVARFRLGAS